jgi:electron transfer flavoprotein beta subunit
MAIGADRGILLETQGEDWDAQATAAAIVEAIRGEEPFDLLLFGNESADAAGYQVGIRVAHALGLQVVTGLKKIELRDGGGVRCERDVGGARDVYETPLPAVLTVLEGLNLPRYPSVPGRLRAKQKPLARAEVSAPAPQLEKLRLAVPEGQGKQAEILGEGAAAAARVVEVMQALGVA